MKKKILLTGGQGFFCSRFALYHQQNFEIVALGRRDLDITDESRVMDRIMAEKPDYIIHAAANAVTDFCNKNPEIAHEINVGGAVNTARAAAAIGAKFLFISSEQVFNGNENRGPYTEEDEAVPDTVYGQNKLEAEALLRKILPELWIVRFTWLFGMPERHGGMANNILWDTLQHLIKNRRISASPHEFRGMTYVYEMVENVEKCFSLPYGTYHLGAENHLSRYEIVAEIFRLLGAESRIPELLEKDALKYAGRPRDVRLNTQKAQKLGLVFTPTDKAIEKCLKEYRML